MSRRLIILYDGTWNTPEDETNVSRLRRSIAATAPDGIQQRVWYDPGVGTSWYNRLSGGLFGRGLSENIKEGYQWLAENYQEADEIFLFGFSRGAYTARSLAGLIRKCGILNTPDPGLIETAYEIYRRKDEKPDTLQSVAFRHDHCREVRIRFIGVWDTVGSLGLPISSFPFNRDYYLFHNTELSGIIDHAYHALAIDEHRKDYSPTLWTNKPENTVVEQCWFVGAHANVGGGYKNDMLPLVPLKWMKKKAAGCGLAFDKPIDELPYNVHMQEIRDSFKEFLWGLYRMVKRGKRSYREIGKAVGEMVHESAMRRFVEDEKYRPQNLVDYFGGRNLMEQAPLGQGNLVRR